MIAKQDENGFHWSGGTYIDQREHRWWFIWPWRLPGTAAYNKKGSFG